MFSAGIASLKPYSGIGVGVRVGVSRRYICLPLQIFVIKSEPQQIFLKTFWILIFMDN